MLSLDVLPEKTRVLFDLLAKDTRMSDFVLIGGTALALQKKHRLSEDLDFWLPEINLDKQKISGVIRDCIGFGFEAIRTTPESRIVAAKINGLDLLGSVQDYVIGGVKITFLARNDALYQNFNRHEKIRIGDISFGVMGSDGIFAMKSHLIHCRTRSRDLYDLMTFIKEGRDIGDVLQAAVAADPTVSIGYGKSVLRGDVPLDKEDEGFLNIGVQESIEDVRHFLSEKVDLFEQDIAEGKMIGLAAPGTYIGSLNIFDDLVVQNLGREEKARYRLKDFNADDQALFVSSAEKQEIVTIRVSLNFKPSVVEVKNNGIEIE